MTVCRRQVQRLIPILVLDTDDDDDGVLDTADALSADQSRCDSPIPMVMVVRTTAIVIAKLEV